MSGSSGLSVDLAVVAELAGELARFAGDPVFAEAQVANRALNAHAPFGVASASGIVVEARSRYTRNMVSLVGSIHEYAREAAALAMALGQTVSAYRGSDTRAGVQVAAAGNLSPGGSFVEPVEPAVPGAVQVVSAPPPAHVAVAEARVRSGWCTNWSAYHAPSLWQMVEPDNVCAGADQELAWRRVADSLADQAARLQRCREELAGAWSSPHAAQAMLHRLDRLIADMRLSAGVAASTRAALRYVNEAVAGAQRDLRRFADEYAGVSSDLMVRSLDGAEDEVNEKARIRMANLEREIRDAVQALPEIPKYVSPAEIALGGIQPDPVEAAAAGGVLARRRPPSALPGMDPVLPPGQEWVPGSRPDQGFRPDQGLQLSGVPGGTGPVVGVVDGVIRHVPATPPPAVGVPAAGVPAGGYYGAMPVAPWGGSSVRAVPPGAVPEVIRSTPPGAGARPGVGGVNSGGAGRAAGPGGAGPAGMIPGGAGPAGMISAGSAGGRGRAGSEGRAAVRPGDVVWEVRQGVPPVIRASREPVCHDPGPGVIGIDR